MVDSQDLVIELSKYPAFQELDIQQTIRQLNALTSIF